MKRSPEAIFTDWVIDLAHVNDWRVAHFHAVRAPSGRTITPVFADGKGWPDLVLVRERVIYAELKARYQKGKLRPEQAEWLERLRLAGAEAYLWEPRDKPEIEDVLRVTGRYYRLLDACDGNREQAMGVMRMAGQERHE